MGLAPVIRHLRITSAGDRVLTSDDRADVLLLLVMGADEALVPSRDDVFSKGNWTGMGFVDISRGASAESSTVDVLAACALYLSTRNRTHLEPLNP